MSNPDNLKVDVLPAEKVGELLTLRRAAFVAEAQLYKDPNIPALTQTLEELAEDLADENVTTLGAWNGPRLVGSIRIGIDGEHATLGRLAVAPDLQGQGIGTKLLFAVIEHLPENTKEIWVFTGKNSKHNLATFNKEDDEHQFNKEAGDLAFAYLEKVLEAGFVVENL